MAMRQRSESFMRHLLHKPKFIHQSVTDLLAQQVDMAIEAAQLADQVLGRETDKEEAEGPMRSLQHDGFDLYETLTESVDVAIAVPLEREDLVRASRTIGDITDNLRNVVREMAMWDVHRGQWCKGLFEPAIKSLEAIKVAIETSDGAATRVNCIKSRHQARKLRRNVQRGLTIIFSKDMSMMVLKQRQILSLADTVSQQLADMSDAILDGTIKRYM